MKKIPVLLMIVMVVMTTLLPSLVFAADREFGEGRTHGQVGTPQMIEVSPADGAVNVALDSQIGFVFDIDMDRASVSMAFSVSPYVFGNLSSTCTKHYYFYPRTGLGCGKTYQVSVGSGAKSRRGVNVDQAYAWSFTTISCQGGQNDGDGDQGGGSDDQGDNNDDNSGGQQNNNSDYSLTLATLQSGEIKVGDEVGVNIMMQNIGDNQLTVLPVEYSFDQSYLEFLGSTPAPDVISGGSLKWNDLTEYFGNLEAGGSINFDLSFKALINTESTSGTLRGVGVQDYQGQVLDEKSSLVSIAISGSSESPEAPSARDDEGENNSDSGSGGSSSVSSSSSLNGSGGYIPAPSAQIDYSYPPEKRVGKEYVESIRVTNTGGVVLTHGELILDLPEDKIEFIAANPTQASFDASNQIIKWQIPALGMDREFSVNLVIRPIAAGEAFTQVSYLTDQLDRRIDRQEVVLAVDHENTENTENTKTQKHEIIKDTKVQEVQKKQDDRVRQDVVVEKDEDESLSTAIEINMDADGEEVEGEKDEFVEDEPMLISEEQDKLSGKIEVPGEVAGIITICAKCPWWVWVLVIILHFVALIIYYYHTVLEEEEEIGEGAEKKINVIKGSWSWWWRVLICLAIIFVLFNFVGHFNPWLLALILVMYFAGLAMVYALIRKAEKKDWIILPILVLASVVVPAIVCGGWGVASWVITIILLLLILVNYYYFVSLIKSRRLWALLPFWLTLLVFVMEILVRRCFC